MTLEKPSLLRRTCLNFILVFFIVLNLPLDFAFAIPTVVSITESSTDQISNENVRGLLRRANRSPVNLDSHPELAPALARIQNFLLRNIQAENSNHHYNLVLVDDMSVNAGFLEHDDGERTILLNLGLLHFVQNDDELAFVLGHEFNHGISQIESYVEHLHADGDKALAKALRRTVESEVDTKSLIRWLHERGYNPHAALHFMQRLLNAYGNDLSDTHASTGARWDVLNLAIVALSRGGGQAVKADEPSQYAHEILGPLQDRYLHHASGTFAQDQLQRVRAVFDSIGTGPETMNLDAAYQAVHNPAKSRNALYHETYGILWQQIQNLLGSDLVSPEDRMELQLELHQRLDAAYEAARARHVPSGFVPNSPEALRILQDLDERRYGENARKLTNARKNVQNLLTKIQKLQGRRSELTAAELSSLQALQRELPLVEQRYREERILYEGNDVESIVDQYLKFMNGDINLHDHPLLDQLHSKLRVLGPMIQTSKTRATFLRSAAVDFIIDSLNSNNAKSWATYNQLPEEVRGQPERLRRAFQAATRGNLQRFQDGKSNPKAIETLTLQWGHYISSSSLAKLFHEYNERSPVHAREDFKEYLRAVFNLTTSADEMSQLATIRDIAKEAEVFDTRPKLFPVSYDMLRRIKGTPALQFHLPFAQGLFADTEFLEFYHRTYEDHLQKLFAGLPSQDLDAPVRNHETILHALQTKLTIESGFFDALRSEFLPYATNIESGHFREARTTLQRSLFRDMNPPLSDLQASVFLAVELGLRPTAAMLRGTKLQEMRQAWRELRAHPQMEPLLKRRFQLQNIRTTLFLGVDDSVFYDDCMRGMDHISQRQRSDSSEKTQDDAFFRNINGFIEWLERQHPDRVDLQLKALLLAPQGVTDGEGYRAHYRRIVSRHARNTKARFQHLPLAQRTSQFAKTLKEDLRIETVPSTAAIEMMSEAVHSCAPFASAEEELSFRNAVVSEVLGTVKQNLGTDLEGYVHPYFIGPLERTLKDYTAPGNRRRNSPDGKISPRVLAESLALVLLHADSSPDNDQIFERTWEIIKGHPEAREILSSESLVGRLFYDENRKILATQQLEQKLNLSQTAFEIRSHHDYLPDLHHIRTVVHQAHGIISKQFPEPSAVKNEILNHVQKQLITNQAETQLLDQGRMNETNWYQSKKLALLDLPHAIDSRLSSNLDRIELIQYLNGTREVFPDFITRTPYAETATQALETARRQFFAADPVTRAFTLQPYLGNKGGIMQEASAFELLTTNILGEHARSPVFRALFESYLSSLKPGERRIIIGHILGSFADKPPGQNAKNASVRSILEAMGPFGIKAGQFLRSSGLVGPELRRDLDHFFDNALPPTRGEIFRRLRAVFGQSLTNVESVGSIVGAGSLNYVVLVDLYDPVTGQVKRAVVRFSRSTTEEFRDTDGNLVGESLWQRVDVAGQIEHENQIWQQATRKLRGQTDHNIQRVGQALEEARAHAMSTLGRDGPELNLSFERGVYPEVATSYRAQANPETGYSVDVVPPDHSLQSLVPERFSNAVSVYEFVHQTPLTAIEPPSLRAALARQIIDAEMRALLVNGIYDADGHRGNWLVDTQNRRLRRIDYSQRRIIAPGQREGIRENLTLMLSPQFGRNQIRELTRNFRSIFEYSGSIPHLERHLTAVVGDPDFPSFVNPQERLLHIMERMETRLTQQNGKLFPLRLNTELLGAINSISRAMVFREQAGEQAAVESLFAHLELNPRDYRNAFVRHKLAENIQSFRNFVRERWTAGWQTIKRILNVKRRILPLLAVTPSEFSERLTAEERAASNSSTRPHGLPDSGGTNLDECIINTLGKPE